MLQPRHARCTALCEHVTGIPGHYYAQLIALVICLEDLINPLAHHRLSLHRSVSKLGAISQARKEIGEAALRTPVGRETVNPSASHPGRYKAPCGTRMKPSPLVPIPHSFQTTGISPSNRHVATGNPTCPSTLIVDDLDIGDV